MTTLTIELLETDYQRLMQATQQFGKSVAALAHEWIALMPETAETFDVTQDPIYRMTGYDVDAPVDFATNPDAYLYGGGDVQ